MKLKTVISAVSFFATLPCALLGLLGGEVVAQTLTDDWGFGNADTNLVVCYKGKSLFAECIKIVVNSNNGYTFTPAGNAGWHPQISVVSMRDGTKNLLLTVGDEILPCTHFLLYQFDGQQAKLVSHTKIFN